MPSTWYDDTVVRVKRKRQLNDLILDYLDIQGYKEAAELFSEEAHVAYKSNSAALQVRLDVRASILHGDVFGAINRLNLYNPEILDTMPALFFQLQQLHMIELLRAGRMEEALSWAAESLAPLGEDNPDLFDDLEKGMSLFVLDMHAQTDNTPAYAKALYSVEHRQEVADALNAAILAFQRRPGEARLPRLLGFMQAGNALDDAYEQSVDSDLSLDEPMPGLPSFK